MGFPEFFFSLFLLGFGWFAARHREIEKERQDKRLQVYSDVLDFMGWAERPELIEVFLKRRQNGPLSSGDLAKLNDAEERFKKVHLQLMVFGSEEVIRAVSDFYNNPESGTQLEMEQYAKVIKTMREDGYHKSYPQIDRDVGVLLLPKHKNAFEQRSGVGDAQ